LTTDTSSAPDRVAITRQTVQEVWNAGNFRLIDQYVAPDFVSHDPTPEDVRGPDALKAQIAAQRDAFPDFHLEAHDVFEHDDKVVTRWRATGTHRGDFMGLAPTERCAAAEGITIDRWVGGRVVESWVAYDVLSVLQQLGAAPAPGSVTERMGKRLQHIAVRTRRLRGQSSHWIRDRRSRARASG
jgi:steroid delta-isomerase-like uncharacterized protein